MKFCYNCYFFLITRPALYRKKRFFLPHMGRTASLLKRRIHTSAGYFTYAVATLAASWSPRSSMAISRILNF